MFYSLTMLFPGLPGQVMPSEKVHEKMFVGCDRRFKKPSYPAVSRYNKKRTAEEVEKMTHRLLRKEAKLRKKLAARGIDYNFPGFVSIQINLSKWSLCTWRVPAVSQCKPRFSTVFFLQSAQVPRKSSAGVMNASTCSEVRPTLILIINILILTFCQYRPNTLELQLSIPPSNWNTIKRQPILSDIS